MLQRFNETLRLAPVVALCLAACGAESEAGRGPDAPEASGGPGSGLPGDPSGPSSDGTDLIGNATACEVPQTSRPPLRRLSRLEYRNAVRDLFAAGAGPAENVSDSKIAGFNSNSAVPLSETSAEAYVRAAEEIADGAVVNWATLSSCSDVADADCAKAFLSELAKRAYRGTVEPAELDTLHQLYDQATATADADKGLSLALQAILLSPRFLYVLEFGAGEAEVVPLSQPEIASRLALSIWRSVPDEALLSKADKGELSSPELIVAEANRMLDDARAKDAFVDFVRQYLELDNFSGVSKVADQYPDFDRLKPDFEQETYKFFEQVARTGDLDALLNAPFTVANQALATFYGGSAPQNPDADGFGIVDLPAERRGVLMQGSVLSDHAHPAKTSPVKMGKLVRQQILCDPPPPPPPGVEVDVEVQPGQPAKEAFDRHSADPACAGCHSLMDPIGHGFGAFDAAGAHVGGEVTGNVKAPAAANGADISGEFSGAAELSAMLSNSEHVAQCYTLQVFRYMLGRAEGSADACALKETYERFAASNNTLREAILGSIASPAFLYRTRVNAGGSCK